MTTTETNLDHVIDTYFAMWNEADPGLLLGRFRHRRFLDTLLIADGEAKHSLSPVVAGDAGAAATRDMLIFFTRKPAAPGHVSYPFDSLEDHPGFEAIPVDPARE